MGHLTFEQVLEKWRDNKQSLSQQMRSNVATECATNLLGDHSHTGLKALQHKYRVAAHAILAADSSLADQVARVGHRSSNSKACFCCSHDIVHYQLRTGAANLVQLPT